MKSSLDRNALWLLIDVEVVNADIWSKLVRTKGKSEFAAVYLVFEILALIWNSFINENDPEVSFCFLVDSKYVQP